MRALGDRRIVGFGLTSVDADRLAEFYVRAFDARYVSRGRENGAQFERRLGVSGGAWHHTLQLGRETVDMLQFDTPGRPYPKPLSPLDTTFQHFAIVVADMERALHQLQRSPGWAPISSGPQHLPQASGGVTAFKFQDPDGHPLELLAFPAQGIPAPWRERLGDELFLGIDHSAISVRDTAISTAFYQTLGFDVTAQSLNVGEEQARLDGILSPHVEVTALSLHASTPHLELLCYRCAERSAPPVLSSNDVAATRIVVAASGRENDVGAAQRLVIDPDGHHVVLLA